MDDLEKITRRLQRGLRKMLAECEEAIRDAQSWAGNRLDADPLDIEWFIVQAAGCRKALDAIDRGERINQSWLQQR